MTDEPDPLAIIAYRLTIIERQLEKVMSAEVYVAKHEALERRVGELEDELDELHRTTRQIIIGVLIAIGTAGVNAARLAMGA